MLVGNQVELAFNRVGVAAGGAQKKRRPKQQKAIVCKRCGGKMTRYADTNIAVCQNDGCGGSFFTMNHVND